MLKNLLVAIAFVAITAACNAADKPAAKLTIPIDKATSPTDGKLMYNNYCAPCHGTEGRGNGPVAPALKSRPTDLTILARNHQGKYPDSHIVTVLQFGSDVKAHGTQQMPVWGPILGKLNQTNAQEKQLRISNLSHYLESIQAR